MVAASERIVDSIGHDRVRPPSPGRAMLRLIRPKQWIKNAFVFAPLIFARSFVHPELIVRAFVAFVVFCIASSATYVFNDLRDVAKDRQHPTKRFTRPIAAGQVSEGTAKMLIAVFLIALCTVPLFNLQLAGVIGLYLGLNAAYTLKLKHVAVVDLFCIASGFVLRVLAGAVAIAVPLSSWMAITTLCLALYLATIKRRQELEGSGKAGRSVLSEYTTVLLDRYAELSALSAIVFYSIFVLEVRHSLSGTIPFVLFGLFRYWFIVDRYGSGESPTDALWKDWPLILTVVCWCGISIIALH